MENLNQAFFFVIDKIINLQAFFIKQAWNIGRVVLLIAILSAALNYALTGSGLKENAVKIMKATLFFLIVIVAYPKIIGFITSWTFDMAKESVYPSVKLYYEENVKDMASLFDKMKMEETTVVEGRSDEGTYFKKIIKKLTPADPDKYFDSLVHEIKHPQMNYYAVPPGAVFKLILLVAGECLLFADKAGITDFNKILKGLLCAFFIILTGIFAVLEYLMAFLEFMLVASVGVILFPLSIWEGSKFMSEKFIGAILGFFIKLLFCNIAIFLMIYGFITLAYQFSEKSFTALPEQIISVVFICLLFFYICKSAPGLAQSLLTGTPSLSAAGAISAAGGAVAAAGATLGLAGKLAGGAAKLGFASDGAVTEAAAAAITVADAGGSRSEQRGAFMSSLAGTAKDAVSAGGLGLARSLLGGGTGGGAGSGGGINPHSWREAFSKGVNKETGEQLKYGEYMQDRVNEGSERGLEYLRNRRGNQPEPASAAPAKQEAANAGNP
jgi:hypothetical protein